MRTEQEILNSVFNSTTKSINTGATGSTDGDTFTPNSSTGSPAMGVYQSTPDTLTASDIATIGIDVNRNVKVNLATKLAGEDLTNDVMKIEPQYSYKNVTASGATVVKTSAGLLHSITFNQAASGTTTVMTDASAAGGTLIGTVKPGPSSAANGQPFTLIYDVLCLSGITASQVSATALGSDLTVAYR